MKDSLGKRIFRIIWKTAAWFFGLSIFFVVFFRFVPVPVTPLMLIRCGEQLFDGKEMKLKHDWISIDKISKHLPLAVFCSEDQNFMNHSGFDIEAIEKSVEASKKGKRLGEQAPFRSKPQKMCFCGRAEAGFEKVSKYISPS